jgi:hypothetical protein
MVFYKIMFEVTVLLVVLSVSSHKGSLSFLLVLVGGLRLVLSVQIPSRISITIQSLWLLWGLMGWKCLVSLLFVHLDFGVVFSTNGRAVGYIPSSQPCFYLNIVVGWMESHENYTL